MSAFILNIKSTTSPSPIILIRLPTDGSQTGTYGSLAYAVSSYTINSGATGSWTPQSFATSTGVTSATATPTITSTTFTGTSVLQVSKNIIFSGKTSGAISLIKYAVPNTSNNTITIPNHGFAANTPISFTSTGTLPTGITLSTIYYVRDITTNTFKISATSGGSAIGLSGTPTGNISYITYPLITAATTAIITKPDHNLIIGDTIFFTTTGSLPGITANKIFEFIYKIKL